MEKIGIRELQQHASVAISRVRRGETLGVTDRGELVAVIVPPSMAVGTGSLVAAGRVRAARRLEGGLPPAVPAATSIQTALDELRGES
ncbi:MAG: type II toxin-antitoxin system Phd/YefM family antitoxin [Candidatus Dormibacteria bacterium]